MTTTVGRIACQRCGAPCAALVCVPVWSIEVPGAITYAIGPRVPVCEAHAPRGHCVAGMQMAEGSLEDAVKREHALALSIDVKDWPTRCAALRVRAIVLTGGR